MPASEPAASLAAQGSRIGDFEAKENGNRPQLLKHRIRRSYDLFRLRLRPPLL